MKPQHIIVIGFKNAGKSTVGRELSRKLARPFHDLDEHIEVLDAKKNGTRRSPREIMHAEGEEYFRELECLALADVLGKDEPLVVAVGGGTPISEENRALMEDHMVVLVKAPKGIVFERIMTRGRPAFFPDDESSYDAFERILAEREPVFKAIADITVVNDGTVDASVDGVIRHLGLNA